MVEVLRMPADREPAAAAPVPALVRLEISNGNGVSGAAARLAETLDGAGLKTVRLTNVKNFGVPLSRIEYQREQRRMAQTLALRLGMRLRINDVKSTRADLRIVLGRDLAKKQGS